MSGLFSSPATNRRRRAPLPCHNTSTPITPSTSSKTEIEESSVFVDFPTAPELPEFSAYRRLRNHTPDKNQNPTPTDEVNHVFSQQQQKNSIKHELSRRGRPIEDSLLAGDESTLRVSQLNRGSDNGSVTMMSDADARRRQRQMEEDRKNPFSVSRAELTDMPARTDLQMALTLAERQARLRKLMVQKSGPEKKELTPEYIRELMDRHEELHQLALENERLQRQYEMQMMLHTQQQEYMLRTQNDGIEGLMYNMDAFRQFRG